MVTQISTAEAAIALQLGAIQQVGPLRLQILTIHLTRPDRLMQPADLQGLSLPAGIDTTAGVVISGRGPVWLYAYLVHELHPTAWVACHDPRLGAIVVTTHSQQVRIGQVIALDLAQVRTGLGPALLIVGPPDSGKSVLSHALFNALLPKFPDVFLQRAQWDGEGNWILELPASATEEVREDFKLAYKGTLTDRFYPYQAEAILKLRRQKPLVIVDVGGRVQPEKVPILDACSHYLIISSKPEEVKKWHEFCRDCGNLSPVAVIHSSLGEIAQVQQREPFLEMTCGPWISGLTEAVPEEVLGEVRSLIT
ncbi:CRISPR-associated protein Csx3 [Nodosilinea sp. LEGE 07088]|uniref:CRISPR-associated ring nuclease Crn3/Csx3 n=1 Tax=Nodosilinea sp. LEGE 07088 TaxID=2777968 RepID=UPI001881AA59|nr:CRISPR-associated ring nuclease Crn3/Csx3 [Nodosilinea sp. LEGE 07088]MBE9138823.1 CRISPR-associated protein Csx3 [Nodosilinea sp. LEGE 07088]